MAICPFIVHFSTWRARSMHDVACEFARAAVHSKDAQKKLARPSLSSHMSQVKARPNARNISIQLFRTLLGTARLTSLATR